LRVVATVTKPKILIQLDTDVHPSVFDAVVAVDAGVERLLPYGGVRPDTVRSLVHGAMVTRGGEDLASTAIFIGGSDVTAGESLLAAVRDTFFGPVRVSVLFDANGANTTAAAAVLAAAKHVELAGASAVVLGASGPVGSRAVRLLARQGAKVRVGSRSASRAEAVCQAVRTAVQSAELTPVATASADETKAAIFGASILIAAGAAGVQLVSAEMRRACRSLAVAIDLDAVPPVGLEGVKPTDKAMERDGSICYGALGVGGGKMKIHKEAIRRLFTANDQVLDAEEIFAIGREMSVF
jgi:hypothetical protein